MSVAIIPARGGSNRIQRKNIKDFLGKPIIAWSIEAAISSGLFERVVVSTDNEEIMEVSKAYGAEVPFLRSKKLADDFTPTLPVVVDAIDRLKLDSDVSVCCLYATAPFATKEILIKSYEQSQSQAHSGFLISATKYRHPIDRALEFKENSKVELVHPENALKRSQDFRDFVHDAGQFYWALASVWKKNNANILGSNTYAFVINASTAVDIDTLEDWEFAENLMKVIQKK